MVTTVVVGGNFQRTSVLRRKEKSHRGSVLAESSCFPFDVCGSSSLSCSAQYLVPSLEISGKRFVWVQWCKIFLCLLLLSFLFKELIPLLIFFLDSAPCCFYSHLLWSTVVRNSHLFLMNWPINAMNPHDYFLQTSIKACTFYKYTGIWY